MTLIWRTTMETWNKTQKWILRKIYHLFTCSFRRWNTTKWLQVETTKTKKKLFQKGTLNQWLTVKHMCFAFLCFIVTYWNLHRTFSCNKMFRNLLRYCLYFCFERGGKHSFFRSQLTPIIWAIIFGLGCSMQLMLQLDATQHVSYPQNPLGWAFVKKGWRWWWGENEILNSKWCTTTQLSLWVGSLNEDRNWYSKTFFVRMHQSMAEECPDNCVGACILIVPKTLTSIQLNNR